MQLRNIRKTIYCRPIFFVFCVFFATCETFTTFATFVTCETFENFATFAKNWNFQFGGLIAFFAC